jgi:TIR domain
MFEWILDNLAIALGGLLVATIVAAWFFRSRSKSSTTYCEPDTMACPAPTGEYEKEPEYPTTVGRSPSSPSEKVEFAVFAPAGVRPNSAFVLDVWAYLRDQYPFVKEMAKEVGMKVLGRKASVSLARGSRLTIRIDIAGLEVHKPRETIEWDGEATNASFTIKVPPKTKIGTYPGSALIKYQSMTIAKVKFIISVAYYDHPEYLDRTDKLMYVRTAFASYASTDREEVLHRIQGMKSIVPYIDIFLDQLSLHSGQNWRTKLEEHVPTKDIFYLFWSEAAARSKWVKREWRLALDRRGLDYISPVPLEEPDRVPPPKELAALHFSDPVLRNVVYERLKRQMERGNQH